MYVSGGVTQGRRLLINKAWLTGCCLSDRCRGPRGPYNPTTTTTTTLELSLELFITVMKPGGREWVNIYCIGIQLYVSKYKGDGILCMCVYVRGYCKDQRSVVKDSWGIGSPYIETNYPETMWERDSRHILTLCGQHEVIPWWVHSIHTSPLTSWIHMHSVIFIDFSVLQIYSIMLEWRGLDFYVW